MKNKHGATPLEQAVTTVCDYIYAIVKRRLYHDHLEQLGRISSQEFVEETERVYREIYNKVQDMCPSFDGDGHI